LEALWDSLMNPNLCMTSIEKRKQGEEKKRKKVEGQIISKRHKRSVSIAYSIQDSNTLLISMNKIVNFLHSNKPHLPTLNP
jgi:hypothetical protein